ncbi:MAG: orotidine-5'-phosphate decarboxylase [Bacteroidales bacterium]|jgi:orotidine-5'-phosphate decarboxylase
MDPQTLFKHIVKKKSYLCIGLDTDIGKIPSSLLGSEHPAFEFNKRIVDATAGYAVAYKPNIAFYESRGTEGWTDLELTAGYIKSNYPDIFLIADAKRGDIGNTSAMYAKTFFEHMNFDAVTVAPYMGKDSVKPFLDYPGKYVIILALTSNQSATDFQYFASKDNKPLFSEVIDVSKQWGNEHNIMYVVGATKASMLTVIRNQVPDHFLLVPGIGAQGGDLQEVSDYGMNEHCGLLINASRSVIFAGDNKGYAEAAAREAGKLQKQMEQILEAKGTI